jgi:hypothetical protein
MATMPAAPIAVRISTACQNLKLSPPADNLKRPKSNFHNGQGASGCRFYVDALHGPVCVRVESRVRAAGMKTRGGA